MPTTYVLRAAASDLTGGADFTNELRVGTETAGTIAVAVAKASTEDSLGFTIANNPSTSGITGTYTVEVNVTVGDTNIFIAIAVSRVNSAGAQQTISAFAAEQAASAGIKTFTLTSINLGTWAAGDRLKVVYRFRNNAAHSNLSVTIETGTVDTEAVAPWTLATQYDQSVAGGLTFSGAFAKQDRKPVAGVLTFSGAIAKAGRRGLAGGLTFAGALATSLLKTIAFTAALTFTGAFAKQTNRALAGGLTFSGSLAKAASRAFIAGLTFAGSLATSHVFTKALAGVLTFAGAIAKEGQKTVAGGLSFAGAITKQGLKAVAGGLTFAGAINKTAQKAIAGALNFASALAELFVEAPPAAAEGQQSTAAAEGQQSTAAGFPDYIIPFPERYTAFARLRLPGTYLCVCRVAKRYESPVHAGLPMLTAQVVSRLHCCAQMGVALPRVDMGAMTWVSGYSPAIANLGLSSVSSRAGAALFWGERRRNLHKEMEKLLKL